MKNSQDMVDNLYAGQLKRMKRLMLFLAAMLFIMSGALGVVIYEQHKSNKTLTNYVQGQSKRISDRNDELEKQHDKLFKAISCLLILHDSHAITDPAVSTEECKKAATEANNELFVQPPQATSDGEPLPGTTSNPTPPQTAPEQPQPATITTPVGTISICLPFTNVCIRSAQ